MIKAGNHDRMAAPRRMIPRSPSKKQPVQEATKAVPAWAAPYVLGTLSHSAHAGHLKGSVKSI